MTTEVGGDLYLRMRIRAGDTDGCKLLVEYENTTKGHRPRHKRTSARSEDTQS